MFLTFAHHMHICRVQGAMHDDVMAIYSVTVTAFTCTTNVLVCSRLLSRLKKTAADMDIYARGHQLIKMGVRISKSLHFSLISLISEDFKRFL